MAVAAGLEIPRGTVRPDHGHSLGQTTLKLQRPSVEYNLTEHCNLKCYGCDHASPLLPKKFAQLAQFVRDLEQLSAHLHSKQLRLVGGEPLLHPQLLDFIKEGRRIGIADEIVVITNGVLLHRMPEEFWRSIDALWLSLYPGVTRTLDAEACEVICRERGISFRADRDDTFHRTLLNQPIEDPLLRQAIFSSCRLAGDISCHTVHEGRFYRCSVAPFMAPRLAMLGIPFENRQTDGVALADNPALREQLKACLSRDAPLDACRYCLGTSQPGAPHHQLDARGLEASLREDHRPLIEQVAARRRAGAL